MGLSRNGISQFLQKGIARPGELGTRGEVQTPGSSGVELETGFVVLEFVFASTSLNGFSRGCMNLAARRSQASFSKSHGSLMPLCESNG
jgi:hypothetical protein